MNCKAIALGTALAGFCLSSVLADEKADHLEPPSSAIDTAPRDHRALIIRAVFHDAWDREILLRAHGDDGGLGLEDYVVALKTRNGNYSVVYFHTSHRLIKYWAPAPPFRASSGKIIPPPQPIPKDYHDINPERCEITITPQLAKQMVAAWHDALMETRYYEAEPFPPPDGGWHEFSMEHNDQTLAGTISDAAEEGSKPGLLISMTYDMRMLCIDRTVKARTALESDVAAFTKQYHPR